jgi:hypothetical protein
MEQDSTKPTLAQFKDACRHEFSFLRELGYSEPQDADPADRFSMRFSNGELTLSIRGENCVRDRIPTRAMSAEQQAGEGRLDAGRSA